VLALCWATTNGWWYVSSYGVPFNGAMPRIGGITVSTIFFALFTIAALYAFWLHFVSRDHGEGRVDARLGRRHPFTAPATRPLASRRWVNRKNARTGMVKRVEDAMIAPQLVEFWP